MLKNSLQTMYSTADYMESLALVEKATGTPASEAGRLWQTPESLKMMEAKLGGMDKVANFAILMLRLSSFQMGDINQSPDEKIKKAQELRKMVDELSDFMRELGAPLDERRRA